jgi:hypothetical protein
MRLERHFGAMELRSRHWQSKHIDADGGQIITLYLMQYVEIYIALKNPEENRRNITYAIVTN